MPILVALCGLPQLAVESGTNSAVARSRKQLYVRKPVKTGKHNVEGRWLSLQVPLVKI